MSSGGLMKYSASKKSCNSLCSKINNPNILGMQKKEEKNQYSKGYNAAIDKCNKRALYIANKVLEAYQKAIRTDEDYNDYDDYDDY